MKVMFAAPYIYENKYKEFSKNSTGFGYMVRDILNDISETDDIFLVTHQFTCGHKEKYIILKHTKGDVLRHFKIKDLFRGLYDSLTNHVDISIRLRYLYYFLDKGYFVQAVKDIQPDIVHIHGLTYQTKPYIEACEELRVPYLVTLHGLNGLNDSVALPDNEKKYEKEALTLLTERKRVVTVVSSGIKRRIAEEYRIPVDHVYVVLNGVSSYKGVLGDERIREEAFHIVCIGNISKHKNQLQLIRAYNLLNDEEKKYIKIFFFGGDSENINIGKEIKKYGFSENIIYYGFVPKKEMLKIWSIADLNVVLSKEEGFGLSMAEGYQYGVPTMTFEDLDAVEDLYNQDAMFLMRSRRDEDVAAGIRECRERQWNRKKIIEWSKNFELKKTISEYKVIYKEIIRNGVGWKRKEL